MQGTHIIDVVFQRGIVTGVELIAVATAISVSPSGDVSSKECHVSWVMLTWMNMGTKISHGTIKPADTIIKNMVGLDRQCYPIVLSLPRSPFGPH